MSPVYQYAPIDTRSDAATIAQAMQRPGDIAAAQALQQGQIWGNAVQNIGQQIGQGIQQQFDPRRQLEQAQLADFKRAQGGRAALATALKTIPPDPQSGTVDPAKVAQFVSAQGFPEQAQSWLDMTTKNAENFAKLREMKRAEAQHSQDLIGDLAFHANSPQDFNSALGMAVTNQLLDEKTALQYAQQADSAGPNGWSALKNQVQQFSPSWKKQQEDLQKPSVIPQGGTLANPAGTIKVEGQAKPKTEAELAVAAAGGDQAAAGAMNLLKPKPVEAAQTKSVLLDGKPAEVFFDPKTKQYTDANNQPIQNAAGRIKPIPPAAIQTLSQGVPDIKLTPTQEKVAADLASGALSFNDFNRLYGARGGQTAALKQAIYQSARDINPDFNPTAFEAGQKMFTNPQIRQRMVAIDQLTPVVDRITALMDKSGNTDLPALNKLIQEGKFQFGSENASNLRQLQTLLGDEVGNALGVGTGSDLKTRLGLDLVNPNLSPANFRAAMQQLKSTLQSRRSSLAQMMGPYGKATETPESSGSGERVRVKGPNGQTGTVPKGTSLPAGWSFQ